MPVLIIGLYVRLCNALSILGVEREEEIVYSLFFFSFGADAVTTTAQVVSPNLPSLSSDEQLRYYVRLNQFLVSVPDLAPMIRGVAGGLGADTLTGVPPTKSPGVGAADDSRGNTPPPK